MLPSLSSSPYLMSGFLQRRILNAPRSARQKKLPFAGIPMNESSSRIWWPVAGIRSVDRQIELPLLDCAFPFAGLLEEVSPLQLAWVVCLPVHGNAVERILQGLARAGIDHAGLSESARVVCRRDGTYLDTRVVLIDVGDECNLGSKTGRLASEHSMGSWLCLHTSCPRHPQVRTRRRRWHMTVCPCLTSPFWR